MIIPITAQKALLGFSMTAILIFANNAGAAVEPTQVIAGNAGAEAASLWEPTLRMVLSLSAVLAALGFCAWLAKRVRNGAAFKGGLIEVISGVSLGGREKVVLLRVGGDEILVGLSPTGMRPLHVLRQQTKQTEFSDYLEASK